MRIDRKTFTLLCISLLFPTGMKAQNAIAISSNPGPGLHVALNWSPVQKAVKYSVFRRDESDAGYPSKPLNSAPIQVLTNCTSIKTLLITKPDSAEWKLVAQALADSNGLFNPCSLSTIFKDTVKYKRLQALAKASMPIALIAGWGYRDFSAVAGKTYFYKIVAMDSRNIVTRIVATDLKVTAGLFEKLPAPVNFKIEPGDDAVQLTWESATGTCGYILERQSFTDGPSFLRVNGSKYSFEIKNRLNGDTIIPSVNGMLDFQRYNMLTGKDSFHLVNGKIIRGPVNGTDYYYRVTALDFFDRPGITSDSIGPAIPRDSTPPSVPTDIMATPDDVNGKVTIRWTQVVKNINGHWERPDSSVRYELYRFASSGNPDSIPVSKYLGRVNTVKGPMDRELDDTDSNLRSQYGNTTWWYRIRSVDLAGNISQWSTAVTAIIKDITPPWITKNVITRGDKDYISVKWNPNPEPDIESYLIYRSLCHLGKWVECLPKMICQEWQSYSPYNKVSGKDNKEMTLTHMAGNKNLLPCPCSGPFVFLAEITADSVKKAMESGHFFFNDRSIDEDDPLCYAYWIKAKDSSGNLSGDFPIPSAAERNEIRCDRLHDLTPPAAALISGLFAQPEQIRVEWIGPPTQDTRAYHVYRAEGTNPAREPEADAYKWVGGMTVELPPALPAILTSPYIPPAMATCDRISVQATPWMSQGQYEDRTIRPKITYWYKVVGIDYDGNETSHDSAIGISTFSFSRKIPDPPVLNTPVKHADPCGITLSWSPPFNPSRHKGFIIYRSTAAEGPFSPVVVAPLNTNSFTDVNVVKGETYWYKAAVLMLNGRLSMPATTVSITP